MTPALLELLRCPETMQRLRMAPPELLARINRAGPGHPSEEAVVREDGTVAYPVRDGLPVLLPEAAIVLATLP